MNGKRAEPSVGFASPPFRRKRLCCTSSEPATCWPAGDYARPRYLIHLSGVIEQPVSETGGVTSFPANVLIGLRPLILLEPLAAPLVVLPNVISYMA